MWCLDRVHVCAVLFVVVQLSPPRDRRMATCSAGGTDDAVTICGCMSAQPPL
jgi:hypothetical protein